GPRRFSQPHLYVVHNLLETRHDPAATELVEMLPNDFRNEGPWKIQNTESLEHLAHGRNGAARGHLGSVHDERTVRSLLPLLESLPMTAHVGVANSFSRRSTVASFPGETASRSPPLV